MPSRKKYPRKKETLHTPDVPSKTDPQGSYTGLPEDPLEVPVQDVDDL